MKPIHILLFAFVTAIVCGVAQPQSNASPGGCTLRIHVDGLRNSTGVVGSAIFKSRDGWPEDMSKTVNHWPTPIPQGAREATAVMENLPAGDYGVVAIHDETRITSWTETSSGSPRKGLASRTIRT
nr:DUF2141 domain-containing protein [Occallatibacter savannae]